MSRNEWIMKKDVYEDIDSNLAVSARKEWIIPSEADLNNWAVNFIADYWKDERPVILMKGDMGSGKTTVVKSILDALHGDAATSPTFSIVNEYIYPPNERINHFDLYRLESEEELIGIGFEEYLDSGDKCLIEWPQLGKNFYHEEPTATLTILILSEGARKIIWQKGIDL